MSDQVFGKILHSVIRSLFEGVLNFDYYYLHLKTPEKALKISIGKLVSALTTIALLTKFVNSFKYQRQK